VAFSIKSTNKNKERRACAADGNICTVRTVPILSILLPGPCCAGATCTTDPDNFIHNIFGIGECVQDPPSCVASGQTCSGADTCCAATTGFELCQDPYERGATCCVDFDEPCVFGVSTCCGKGKDACKNFADPGEPDNYLCSI
jgi:hypothetical protein